MLAHGLTPLLLAMKICCIRISFVKFWYFFHYCIAFIIITNIFNDCSHREM